jgi:tetratricopeptide (TPR) repeat protein
VSKPSAIKVRVSAVALVLFFSPSQISIANAAGGESPVIAPAPATPTPTATPTPSATPAPAVDQLALSRTLIEAKNYKKALVELQRVDRLVPNNADVNNYLGFASRKLAQYKEASLYYTKALKINPNHLGALEYQGELFLTQKKPALAKQNLAKLKRLCGTSCEEYLDLNQAIVASSKKK